MIESFRKIFVIGSMVIAIAISSFTFAEVVRKPDIAINLDQATQDRTKIDGGRSIYSENRFGFDITHPYTDNGSVNKLIDDIILKKISYYKNRSKSHKQGGGLYITYYIPKSTELVGNFIISVHEYVNDKEYNTVYYFSKSTTTKKDASKQPAQKNTKKKNTPVTNLESISLGSSDIARWSGRNPDGNVTKYLSVGFQGEWNENVQNPVMRYVLSQGMCVFLNTASHLPLAFTQYSVDGGNTWYALTEKILPFVSCAGSHGSTQLKITLPKYASSVQGMKMIRIVPNNSTHVSGCVTASITADNAQYVEQKVCYSKDIVYPNHN